LESNNDAVWVFAKYRIQGSTTWSHVTLSQSGAVTAPAGAEVIVTPDELGAFVQRDADGIGDVNFSGITVTWDRNADGVLADDIVEICVLGIEMVFVPTGGFQLGDGSLAPTGNLTTADSLPFNVTSEASLVLGGTSLTSIRSLNASSQAVVDDFNDVNAVTLPTAFPKGFNGFYQMKYEVDQGLYAEMLNKLDAGQAAARFQNSNSFGNTIISDGSPIGGFSTTTPSRTCNFLSWNDFAALADWSGLRPMTEMEFEKSCRGDLPASQNEWAAGSGPGTFDQYVFINDGLPNEVITNPNPVLANALYVFTQSLGRPVRTGIFAASAVNNSRTESGGTRYGAMEMSGNVWEMVISLGSANGRLFEGVHGDGELDASGFADQASWPDSSGQGSGIKGGGVFSTSENLGVSFRFFVNMSFLSRDPDIGGRFVRSSF